MRRLLTWSGASVVVLPLLLAAGQAAAPTPGSSDGNEVATAPPAMRALFVEAARRFALPPALLVAIARVESGFNPDAVGPPTPYGRALGMMQFLPSSWTTFNVVPDASPFDPGPAVLAAANHLTHSGALPRGGWDAARAVFGYNHSTDYVVTVLALAARYGYRDDPAAPPLDPTRYVHPLGTHRATDPTDLSVPVGTPVLACVRGEVLSVRNAPDGWTVTLRGEDGWLYMERSPGWTGSPASAR